MFRRQAACLLLSGQRVINSVRNEEDARLWQLLRSSAAVLWVYHHGVNWTADNAMSAWYLPCVPSSRPLDATRGAWARDRLGVRHAWVALAPSRSAEGRRVLVLSPSSLLPMNSLSLLGPSWRHVPHVSFPSNNDHHQPNNAHHQFSQAQPTHTAPPGSRIPSVPHSHSPFHLVSLRPIRLTRRQ